MPRRARQRHWTDAACYHVLNRGHDRETVFHDDDDRQRFLALLARYRARFAVRLYAYCLMSNHFHLLLQVPRPAALSPLMAGLGVAYWHHYRRRYGLVGHLFQGRFRSPAVEADAYLLSCCRYIERNPVEARLVEEPWAYRWSSCRAHALGEVDALLAPNPWYEDLAADPERRRQLWRAFLVGEDPKEAGVRQGAWVVGGDDFRRRAQQEGVHAGPRRGHPLGPGLLKGDPAGTKGGPGSQAIQAVHDGPQPGVQGTDLGPLRSRTPFQKLLAEGE